MPTVRQRTLTNGRTTYYVVTRDALKRTTSERFDQRKEAEKFARLVEAYGGPRAIAIRNREDHAGDDYVPTVAERLVTHVEELTGVTERTRLDYTAMAKRTWLPDLGSLPLDTIERRDVVRWINAAEKSGLAPKSIANAHALLAGLLKGAVRDGLMETNPCEAIRLPKARTLEAEARYLTRGEYDALMTAMPPRWRPLTALLFGSGLRWSEATALEVRHVQVGSPTIVQVQQAWKRTPGQGRALGPPKSAKARRRAVVSNEAAEYVAPLLSRGPRHILFVGAQGAAVHHGGWRTRVWVPACVRAELATTEVPFDGPGIHDARHTFASWVLSTGQVSLEMLQDQLGHESILTTRKIYADLMPETRNRLADALDIGRPDRPPLLPPPR